MAFPDRIVVEEGGRKSLKRLPREAQRKILKKIQEYEEKPELISVHLKQLTDSSPPITRLRIGDFRAFGFVEGKVFYVSLFLNKKDV